MRSSRVWVSIARAIIKKAEEGCIANKLLAGQIKKKLNIFINPIKGKKRRKNRTKGRQVK